MRLTEFASSCEHTLFADDAGRYADLLRSGCLNLHFQPIVNLRSGEVRGVEALGRLSDAGRNIPPSVFLQHLETRELKELLFQSIDQGISALKRCSISHPNLRLSLNVDPSMFLDSEFALSFLDRIGSGNPRLVTIEILESGEFLNTDIACSQIAVLRVAGIRVALDDVGSAYSSLMRLRTLPVDAIKLDQAFIRELHRKPEDLVFVSSMMSMARGLKKSLIVEGVETPDILDALRVLGVELAQGYAIATPMPVTILIDWLKAHTPIPATSQPTSLLGTYAAHLCLMEACRAMLNQPLEASWMVGVENPHTCLVGKFLDEQEWHDTELGLSHKRLHTILPFYRQKMAAWENAAEDFQGKLDVAIQRNAVEVTTKKYALPLLNDCDCNSISMSSC